VEWKEGDLETEIGLLYYQSCAISQHATVSDEFRQHVDASLLRGGSEIATVALRANGHVSPRVSLATRSIEGSFSAVGNPRQV